MGWMTGVQFLVGTRIFLLAIASRLSLGAIQPLIHWVPWALSPGVKWLGNEADHSPVHLQVWYLVEHRDLQMFNSYSYYRYF